MIAVDTNVLFPALETGHESHTSAKAFLAELQPGEVAVCELVLTEIYVLVRSPATCRRPLGAAQAGELIRRLRSNPAWRLIDYPGGLMDAVWRAAAIPGFARRRVFDARLALTLLHHGVQELATCNVKDFDGLGLARVWSPFEASR
ncbi:MAG: PIN domain-containing protein [Deltaproteobacteria bacterium]|nr:PIN domain-containing protein [Deltaproteobacteria bacterium]